MNYYISDLHLLHKNCIGFDERPFADLEEMHEAILANWNRKVTNSDTVYILGDATLYGKKEDAIALVARMKGKKVLVRGTMITSTITGISSCMKRSAITRKFRTESTENSIIWFSFIIRFSAGKIWDMAPFFCMAIRTTAWRIRIIRSA